MLNLIQTAEHAYAAAAKDAVRIAKFLRLQVLPALQNAEAGAAVIEQVTAMIDPQAVHIERAAFALLGLIIPLIEKAAEAGDAGGVNIHIDAQLLAELKPIAQAIKEKTLLELAGVR